MTTADSPKGSSAEKRALWEVRQRYNVDKPKKATPAAIRPSSGKKPPIVPPHPPRRKATPGGMRKPRKKHWVGKVIFFLFLLFCLGAGIFGYKILAASNKISSAEQSILGQLKDLLFASGQQLKGEADDRINVLLLAVGGEGHSGENLTDTIMIASIRPSDNSVALMSIPRDLYVQVPGEQFYSKLNAVHAYGESKQKDGGPEAIRGKIEEITGQPIHYYGRVDFIAFKSIVDTVGGVNITIPNSFDDYWHKISFPAGTEKMNGERALAYARARYVQGPEGGDFKRTSRQQQLLLAIRDKVFSVNTAFDFTAMNSILDSLSANIRTDMQLWEMRRFFEIARQINHDQVKSVVLSTGPKGILVGGTEVLGGVPASVIKTRTGDYSEIQAIARDIFSDSVSHTLAPSPQNQDAEATTNEEAAIPTTVTAGTPAPSPTPAKKVTIEIRNGTNVTGLAKKTSDELSGKGYEITAIGNAVNRSTQETTVYAIDSEHSDLAKTVADEVGAKSDSGLPSGEKSSSAQVLIILGADAE